MSVKVAILQGDFPDMDRAGNRARVEDAAAKAAAGGAEILALPELWCSGYDLSRAVEASDWEQEFEFLADLSKQTGLAILGGSLLEPTADEKVRNCAVAFDRGAELARYRKVHLFAPLREDRFLEAGAELPGVFEMRGLRCALSVCYDLRFPELYRSVAVQGVDLIVVPAQWPKIRVEHWRTLLRARAIENQCYVLGVNRLGSYGDVEFGGNSLLVDPWGELVVDAEGTGLYDGVIDPSRLQEAREKLPVLRDRRPDLY